VTNVADALQQIAGIDVRRRGLVVRKLIYIWGGSFDQTLLVDGFKLDDVQTGHHSMNTFRLKLLRELKL
jgi:iron complex outermembrane receptor protein